MEVLGHEKNLEEKIRFVVPKLGERVYLFTCLSFGIPANVNVS